MHRLLTEMIAFNKHMSSALYYNVLKAAPFLHEKKKILFLLVLFCQYFLHEFYIKKKKKCQVKCNRDIVLCFSDDIFGPLIYIYITCLKNVKKKNIEKYTCPPTSVQYFIVVLILNTFYAFLLFCV